MQSWKAPKIDKYVKTVDVFVLTCIDPRFTYFLSWFLNHEKQIENNYDLFALAGSSMCADNDTQLYPPGGLPSTAPWLLSLNQHIALAMSLHQITEVWLFDHLGCGAYVNYLGDDSFDKHVDCMRKMKNHIGVLYPDLKVKEFIMDLEGNITLLQNAGGLQKFKLSNYYPQNKWIILFWVTFVILIGVLLSLGYFKK